jgi:glutathione S-transferase
MDGRMPDPGLVLWGENHFESPYVFSCFVALAEKRLRFELRPLALDSGEHRTGEYLARSLTGRVPALQHGDFWLAESSAIDEYLEDTFPPPEHSRLYPLDPRDRARARQVQAWLRSDLLPLRQARPTSSVFSGAPVQPLPDAARAAADHLVRVAEALLAHCGDYLFGNSFCIADADLALALQRLVANGDPVGPVAKAHAQRVWTRPSVQAWLARSQPRR